MRLVIARERVRWILHGTQRLLFGGAFAMLAYCAFVLMDTWTFQNEEHRQLERVLAARQAASPTAPANLPSPTNGGLIGRLEIPRLGMSAIVMEGTSNTTLRRAVGHISGTALPGETGNVGVSAHRDTFFRPLRNIRQGDMVTFTTLQGEYRYRVVSTKVVSADDIAVLHPNGNEILTLITCHPFYFVGSAPDRFIVRAERVGNDS
jgi:sortase A